MTKRLAVALSLGLSLVVALEFQTLGQRPATPAAPAPPGTGPMSEFLGPSDDVPSLAPLTLGVPGNRTADTYYYDKPFWDMPPDEFISNPDTEYDWHQLRAWHIPPILKTMKIIGPRRVKAGDSVQFEAEVADPTGTTTSATLSYYGPQGRRTTVTANFRVISPGSNKLRGTMTIPRHAEPGIYRHVRFGPNNEVRSSRGFFSDYHAAMRGQPLEIEVLANPDADVMPPTLHWFKVGGMDAPADKVYTTKITDAIPMYAKVTDNKTGVGRVWVRLTKFGTNRFQELDLKPLVGQKDIYVAYLSLPKWWEGGEYQATTITVEDKAGKVAEFYYKSDERAAKAKFNVTQNPQDVDTTPPKLISIWVESDRGTMGQPSTINAIVVDDKSGVATVSAVFQPVPSYQGNARVILRKVTKSDVIQKSGLDTELNLYQGPLTTSVWQEPGRWELLRLVARDQANNYLDMLATDHPILSSVGVDMTGGERLREKMLTQAGIDGWGKPVKSGTSAAPAAPAAAPTPRPNPAPMATAPAAPAPATSQGAGAAGKIRRVDMVAPHPPRGACLNCHEP